MVKAPDDVIAAHGAEQEHIEGEGGGPDVVTDHDEEIGTAVVAGIPVRHDLATDALPPLEFAFPGPLRDRLAGLVASGAKTTTSSLAVELFIGGQSVGEQSVGGDSAGAGEEPEGMPAVGER